MTRPVTSYRKTFSVYAIYRNLPSVQRMRSDATCWRSVQLPVQLPRTVQRMRSDAICWRKRLPVRKRAAYAFRRNLLTKTSTCPKACSVCVQTQLADEHVYLSESVQRMRSDAICWRKLLPVRKRAAYAFRRNLLTNTSTCPKACSVCVQTQFAVENVYLSESVQRMRSDATCWRSVRLPRTAQRMRLDAICWRNI